MSRKTGGMQTTSVTRRTGFDATSVANFLSAGAGQSLGNTGAFKGNKPKAITRVSKTKQAKTKSLFGKRGTTGPLSTISFGAAASSFSHFTAGQLDQFKKAFAQREESLNRIQAQPFLAQTRLG